MQAGTTTIVRPPFSDRSDQITFRDAMAYTNAIMEKYYGRDPRMIIEIGRAIVRRARKREAETSYLAPSDIDEPNWWMLASLTHEHGPAGPETGNAARPRL